MEIDLSKLTPDIRHLNDMRQVLADKDFSKNSPDMDLYFMYRGLEEKNGLRYDITVVLAKIVHKEELTIRQLALVVLTVIGVILLRI